MALLWRGEREAGLDTVAPVSIPSTLAVAGVWSVGGGVPQVPDKPGGGAKSCSSERRGF